MTRFIAYLGEAIAAIRRNGTRSALTMLGMIIGTASIIAVFGISRAASSGIAATLSSFGNGGIAITATATQNDPARAAIAYRDVAAIAARRGDVIDRIFPNYQRNYAMRGGRTRYTAFVASDSDYHPDGITMSSGRRIDTADVAGAARVCNVTETIAQRFFGNEPAIGRTIAIAGTRFRVVGVYADLKGGFFSSVGANDFVSIPYTTFHQIAPGPIDTLQVYPRDGVPTATATAAVIAELQRLHGKDARYDSQDATGQLDAFAQVINVIALGLSAIGGIALLVAGIGIMNVMLVSVTERTREIGIRKSIGAAGRDIALQFLLEAVVLSLLGGALGTLLGLVVTVLAYNVVESFLGPAPIPYLLIVGLAVSFSMFVGTVFGTYPALRAARMDPIAALRS